MIKRLDCLGITEGLNLKRLTLAIVAVFIWILASDFVVHQLLLKSAYQATPNLWRTDSEIQEHMVWMLLGQFLIAKFFTLIFAKGYTGKGLIEGVRFGLLAAFLTIGHYLIQYAVNPLTCSIALAWIGAAIVQSVLAGMVAAAIYRQ